jgi:hypothetical protein
MWGSDMVWWDSRSAPGLAGELSRENVWGSLQKRRLKMFGMGYRAHQSKSLGPAWASGETMCNARALNFHGVNMDAVHMVWRSQGWNRIEKSWKFTLASGSPLQCLLIIWSECYIYIYTLQLDYPHCARCSPGATARACPAALGELCSSRSRSPVLPVLYNEDHGMQLGLSFQSSSSSFFSHGFNNDQQDQQALHRMATWCLCFDSCGEKTN